MPRKKKPEPIREVCRFCRSYSRSNVSKGWCMKFRRTTDREDTCSSWN